MFHEQAENPNAQEVNVLSIHWGFDFGGVAKYAILLEKVASIAPVNIHSVCVLSKARSIDVDTKKKLSHCHDIHIKGLFDLSWLKKLKADIEKLAPSLVITHGFNAHFASWLVRFCLSSPVKCIASYHGEYYGSTPLRKCAGILYNRFTLFYLKRFVHSISSVAAFCKEYLISEGIAEGKLVVIHNGIEDVSVNSSKAESLRDDWLGNGSVLVGVVSRLEPIKGVDVLLSAMARLRDKYPHVRLVIVGDGVQKAELRRRVVDLGMEACVVFAGYRTDIAECIEAFDIYVLPSYREAHSIALLEAMRAGKAIVATDVGGNTESARPDQEALIIPPGNPQLMSVALEQLVVDASLAEKIGTNSRDRFQKEFTEDRTVEDTADWLLNCLSEEKSILRGRD